MSTPRPYREPRPFRELTKGFSPERRAKIEEGKKKIRLEMAIQEVRQATGFTQVELAERMGVKQSVVSRMERADDLNISTLDRLVDAFGGKLRLVVDLPGCPEITLFQFHAHHSAARKAKKPMKKERALAEA